MHCQLCNGDFPEADHCPHCAGTRAPETPPERLAGPGATNGTTDPEGGSPVAPTAVVEPEKRVPDGSRVAAEGETELLTAELGLAVRVTRVPGEDAALQPQPPEPPSAQPPGSGETPTLPVDPPKAEGKAEGTGRGEGGGAEPVEIKDAKIHNVNVSRGDNPIFANHVNMYARAEREEKETRALRPLLELTSELPVREAGGAEFAAAEVEPRVQGLSAERLLIISCVDADVGRAAAHAVVERVGAAAGQARLLNFDRVLAEDAPRTVYDVIHAPGERAGETLIVVDAVSHRAQAFLDHLLDPGNGLWSAQALRGHLAEARLLAVCLAPPERFAAVPHRAPPFAHWAVPFLEHLLSAAYPSEHHELQAEIRRQQAVGRWSRHEGVFCGQLRGALANGSLKTVVAAGGPSFGGEVTLDEEQPVHNTVLYTAGYFSRLNPGDFGRVVTLLLGEETMEVPAAAPAVSPPSADRPPAAPKEKKLAQTWRESGDRILRECRLTVLKDTEGGRTVGFADPAAGDRLREHFEDEYAFTLHTRFASLHQAGLLFDGSDPVAANVVRLTADMVAGYPESYGRDWLVELLAEALVTAHDPAPVFRRFAELMRGLCGHAVLQPLVAGVMERLLATGAFPAALALVKRLRFAPGFDEFHWMRQLVDRAAPQTRRDTSRFLYGEVMKMGPQVHPILHALQPWLPAEDRDPDKYSPSNRLALRLLVDYAVETVSRWKDEDYGAWPSRYPLLAVSSAEAAERDLPLVVGWLLHPGVAVAVAEDDEEEELDAGRLAAALLAEWVFILFGPAGRPADAAAALPGEVTPSAPASFGPESVLAVLLREVAAGTESPRGRELRKSMLEYWEETKDALTLVISHLPSGSPLRAECTWKRPLLRMLLLRIRSQRSPAAFAAGPVTV